MPPSSNTRTLLLMVCCNVSFDILTVLFWNVSEDSLQALSKRHILCYDKREELLPGGNSPGAAEYIQIYYNPFRPVFPQKPADFVQNEFAS